MEYTKIERNWIAICGSFKAPEFRGMLINIYKPCNSDLRKEVWDEIVDFWNLMNVPCLIMGDFNEVLNLEERGSQSASQRSMTDFKKFMQRSHMIDIPPTNGKYSWFRGNSKSRLDRLILNLEWLTNFPSLKTSLLNRTFSDHSPLLASISEKNWGPRPFRFLNCWTSHPTFLKLVEKSWLSSPPLPIHEKLKALKSSLKEWNANEFGHIDSKITHLESTLHSFDTFANTGTLDENEIMARKSAHVELWEWSKKKEVYGPKNLGFRGSKQVIKTPDIFTQ